MIIGKDAMGCYGNLVIQTPALDRLTGEGILFNNAYCTRGVARPAGRSF